MISSFCVSGSSDTRPLVKANWPGISINAGDISLSLDWESARLLAGEIIRLADLEKVESLSTPGASQR